MCSAITVNFQASYNNYKYASSRQKTKMVGAGVSSAILPGTGQLCNGETSKGIAFLLATLCTGLVKRYTSHNTLALLSRIGISLWAAKDAIDNVE